MGKSPNGTAIDSESIEKVKARLGEPVGRELGFGWVDQRQAALDELRQHDFPETLINLARELLYASAIKWRRQSTSSPHPALKHLTKQPIIKRPTGVHPAFGLLYEMLQAGQGAVAYTEQRSPKLTTAGELLAYLLLWNLAALEIATKDKRAGKKSTSPIRGDSLLSRSTIGSIAIDILEHCEYSGRPPGPQLTRLMRALVNADRLKLNQTRDHNAAWMAAWVVALDEHISTRELAARVGVTHGTISKWRNEEWFKKKVEKERELIEALTARGYPPKLHPMNTSGSED